MKIKTRPRKRDSARPDVAAFSRRRHNSPLRAVAARFLIRYAGLSQRAVADLLNIGSGAAVCNQLKRLPDRLAADRRLGRLFKMAEERLEARKRDNLSRARASGRDPTNSVKCIVKG